MRFFSYFRNNFKKLVRVYAFLFVLAILIPAFSSILSSCSNEDYYEYESGADRTKELTQFKNAMKKASNELKILPRLRNSSKEEIATEFVGIVHQDALNLIKSYGFTEADIINEFGSLNSNGIVLAAQAILNTEELIDKGQTLSIFTEEDHQMTYLSFLGLNSTYAQTDTIGGCLADAIGISAAFELVETGIAGLGKKGALKLLKKVAGRALGPIGLALAVYDFADCMEWTR